MKHRKLARMIKQGVFISASVGLAICLSQAYAEPTLQDRKDAASKTALNNPVCQALQSFYWEIGDENGPIVSDVGGDGSRPNISESTEMHIASASKWIFAAYALEKLDISQSNPLTTDQIQLLNFTSGYDNLVPGSCDNTRTVSDCATKNDNGVRSDGISMLTDGSTTPNHIGGFSYSGGHLQHLAMTLGLGSYYDSGLTGYPKLATEVMNQVGQATSLRYSTPELAGGIEMRPSYYRQFLQDVLSGTLRIKNYLGSNAVCAWTDESCSNPVFKSPVSDYTPKDYTPEHWHYSLGHWVEDDPRYGDGAYSSPGAYGFYPWIDKDKKYYGMVAHESYFAVTINGVKVQPFVASAFCGQKIRRAWASGQEDTSTTQEKNPAVQ